MIVYQNKTCTNCLEEKSILFFYYQDDGKFQVAAICDKCSCQYQKKYRKDNAKKISKQKKTVREKNKEKIHQQEKESRARNKEKISQRNKRWYRNNKQKSNEYHKQYIKNKTKKDHLFRLRRNVRARIWGCLKQRKTKRSVDYLGISMDEYKKYLSSLFLEGMTWDNYGDRGWHIDHIIPLSSAKTEEELIKLFHYTNTQPLWADENLKKSNKIF